MKTPENWLIRVFDSASSVREKEKGPIGVRSIDPAPVRIPRVPAKTQGPFFMPEIPQKTYPKAKSAGSRRSVHVRKGALLDMAVSN